MDGCTAVKVGFQREVRHLVENIYADGELSNDLMYHFEIIPVTALLLRDLNKPQRCKM